MGLVGMETPSLYAASGGPLGHVTLILPGVRTVKTDQADSEQGF